MVAAFSSRVRAGGPVEIEGVGYYGAESGHYSSCDGGAASVGARYGGVGFEGRLHPAMWSPGEQRSARAPANDVPNVPAGAESVEAPHGFSLRLGVASEVFSPRLLSCEGDCAGFTPQIFRPNQWHVGGRLRLGYDWTYFGFEAGIFLVQPFTQRGLGTLGDGGGPDFLLRFGPLATWRVELGLGAYNEPTILRPGAYVGFGMVPAPGWDIVGHLGSHLIYGEPTGRYDIEVRAPVSSHFQIGLGVAATTTGAEGRALGVATF